MVECQRRLPHEGEDRQIESDLRNLIHREFLQARAVGPIDIDQDLVASGIIDSLAFIGLVSDLERTFGIVVGDGDLSSENFTTLRAMTAYVQRRQV